MVDDFISSSCSSLVALLRRLFLRDDSLGGVSPSSVERLDRLLLEDLETACSGDFLLDAIFDTSLVSEIGTSLALPRIRLSTSLSSLAISLLPSLSLAFADWIKASDISETFDFVGGGGL